MAVDMLCALAYAKVKRSLYTELLAEDEVSSGGAKVGEGVWAYLGELGARCKQHVPGSAQPPGAGRGAGHSGW